MIDFSHWALADYLTVEQAACLWAGVDPHWYAANRYSRDPAISTVAPFLQMLSGEIQSGTLVADSRGNPAASVGYHERSLVARRALMVFAVSKKQQPAFLFDTLMPADDPSNAADLKAKNVGGRPAKWDWDGCIAEIVRIADLDNLPDTQAELVGRLKNWFIQQTGDHPADSDIKSRVSKIYNRLGKGRKPVSD